MIKTFTQSLFTAFLVLTLAFFSLRLSPGDPVERILGPQARIETIESYRATLGLDQPIMKQYFIYLKEIATLNWGHSLFKNKSVLTLISEAMKPTILLASLAMVISFVLSSLIGVFAALRRGRWPDHVIRLLNLSILSFPIFSLAPLLILFWGIYLNLLPVSELSSAKHFVLPVMALVFPLTCVLSRVVRNQYLEVLNEPWVTVLKSKGLSPVSVCLRVFKVILPTVLTIISMQLSSILAGAMITESIFDIHGLGRLLLQSLENRDYPLVQGLLIYSSLIYLALYVLTDLVNRQIDPRMREQ